MGVIGLGGDISNLAKTLRSNSTNAERLLWIHLRNKQLDGLKFRRQHPLGSFIVDFVCLEKHVAIEVDGGQHNDNKRDINRDNWLIKEGYKVLRFWNNEVFENIDSVLAVIRDNCISPSPQPPSPQGRG